MLAFGHKLGPPEWSSPPVAPLQEEDVGAADEASQASPETDPNLERLLLWKAERTLRGDSESDGAAGRRVRGSATCAR